MAASRGVCRAPLGWRNGTAAAGSTMGIAGCSAFGSHIGLVATRSIGSDQRVKVQRLAAAVDCGRAVNSGLVQQQIEAGLIWALAQATVPAARMGRWNAAREGDRRYRTYAAWTTRPRSLWSLSRAATLPAE